MTYPPPGPGRDWFHSGRGGDDAERELARLWARLDYIDANGTRGVGPIHTQLANVIADLSELKTSVGQWQKAHHDEHAEAASNAVAGRRWVIGTCITALVLLLAVLTLLFQIAGKIR